MPRMSDPTVAKMAVMLSSRPSRRSEDATARLARIDLTLGKSTQLCQKFDLEAGPGSIVKTLKCGLDARRNPQVPAMTTRGLGPTCSGRRPRKESADRNCPDGTWCVRHHVVSPPIATR